jgi:hypothetical protein
VEGSEVPEREDGKLTVTVSPDGAIDEDGELTVSLELGRFEAELRPQVADMEDLEICRGVWPATKEVIICCSSVPETCWTWAA